MRFAFIFKEDNRCQNEQAKKEETNSPAHSVTGHVDYSLLSTNVD